ncbi:MAG: LamG-like jellyroll fold domain-containing protein, partial [Bacteroidota bacterium]
MIHRSIQINWIFFILFLLFPFSVDAQDGPGGIGNADGSDGQPELKLWLLPDSLDETDDQEIDTWNDFSGNDNHLTGAGSNGSPVFRENFINGHSGVQFQYDKSRAVINSFDMPSEAVSVFFVLRTDGTQRLSPLSYAASDNDDNEYMFISDHPGSGDFATFVNGNNYSEPFTYNDNDWKILTHQWRSDDGRMYLHENGTQIFNTTHQTGAAITSGGTLSIGAEQDALDGGYQSSDDFEDGEMAEVIIYGSSLKQAQRVVIENYLAQKYGLDANLATDHYQPGDASYSVAMTGMGKESDGAIEANAEGIHLSENGGLENGEYLMSAHDGTSNTEDEINTGSEVTNAGVDSAWNRSWYIDKTGNFNAKIAFDFGEGIDGKNPGELQYYELLYRDDLTDDYSTVTVAGKGVQNGDQIYFEVDDANLADGYYTLGSSDKDESPLTGVEGRTWYTLVSGDWDDWETWTLDPSGSLPDNPDQRTPSASDNVVILSGKTVTVNQDNVSASELTVEGRLDFQAHTGQTFGKINGGGRILLGADNFPTGADASHFYTPGEGEGTIVYYGNSYDLDQALECYDLEVNLDNASDQLTLLKSYTINGNLTINQGQLQVNDNSSTTDLAITVQEDLGIESDGSLLTGSANARHQLNLYGDFTNNGTAEFTNRASADYNNEASDGIVDVNFLSDNSNQSLYCNGTTNFYRIEIDKGSDATYQLEMEATDPSYFNLYGPADYEHPDDAQLTTNENALGLLRGTVRLKNNVDVPVLNNSVNYNVSKNARLWIDGGSIAKSEGTAIVPYGKILVSSGTLESTASSGITTRENGLVKVEGGTLSINQLRTSVFGDDNIGGYVQTGGTTNILGGSTSSEYYCFNLTYPGNV